MTSAFLLATLNVMAPAKVLTVVGTVEAKLDAGYEQVQRFQLLDEGTELRTRAKSRITLRLASGTVLRLGPSTTVTLTEMDHDSKIRARRKESISLKAGRIWASVLSLFGDDSKFEIDGPNAVAGVRGTSFIMTSDENGERVVLEEGEVEVSMGDELFELDEPGQFFNTSDRSFGQLAWVELNQLQTETGGRGVQLVEAILASPASEEGDASTPGLQLRQEINGQDEVADSEVTLDNDPSNETRDISEVIIRLVPESD